MPTRLQALKNKAKMLQKAKKKSGKDMLLKDAFELIAKTAGYKSWRELKATLDDSEVLGRHMSSAMWNVWYNSYDEALPHLTSKTFLLPYEKQFFICDEDFIRHLGLDLEDKDLSKIGNNWAKPADKIALSRLMKRIR